MPDPIVIAGGAIMGSAVAARPAALGAGAAAVEPDPTFARAAASLCASGVRRQVSNPIVRPRPAPRAACLEQAIR